MTEQIKPEPSQKDLDAMGTKPEDVKPDSVEQMGHIVTNWHFRVVADFHHKLRMPVS